MATFALTFLIILAALAGGSLGVLIGRAALAGHCGGLSCTGCRHAGSPACRREEEAAP